MTITGPSPPAEASSPAAAGLSGAGAPLEPGARDQFSAGFGHDFSAVRIHAGPEANIAARDLGALAYTVGNDVVFAEGAYDPLTSSGRSLIAHELAHVAQHSGRAYAPNYLTANPAAGVRPAAARLEHQAHLAADLHALGLGLPRNWAWERSREPFVGKADVAWSAPATPYSVSYAGESRPITQEQWSPDDSTIRVNLGAFVVPEAKGPFVKTYADAAAAQGLQAVLSFENPRARAALWQQRAPTAELRRLWMTRLNWTKEQAPKWWEEAGGQPVSETGAFRAADQDAQIDHIIELQLGGTNVPENLATHSERDNRASGNEIWTDISNAGADVKSKVANRHGKKPRNIALHFSGATQKGTYSAPKLTTLPAPGPAFDTVIKQREHTAINGLQVHFTALADKEAGTRPGPDDLSDQAKAIGSLSRYPITSGTSTAELRVPPTPTEDDLLEGSAVPANHAARELISGLALTTLNRRGESGRHTIIGFLNSKDHPPRTGTRLPLVIRETGKEDLTFLVTNPGTEGRLRIQDGSSEVQFTYPYLSAGRMSLTTDDAGNLEGHGTLTPSVKLLSRVPITVDWDRNGFRGSVQAPTDRLSLPPFRVTEAALTLNLAPQLSAGGHVVFVVGTIAQGRIEAGVDAQGIFAQGIITATIPGLDTAKGEVAYRPASGLTGFVVVRASRPSGLVRSGEVRLDLTPAGWAIGGQVNLMLPGGSPAQLTVRSSRDRVLYTGRATINVPALRPVDVDLSYDGTHLEGSARTTFTVLGANGEIALRYRDGRFTGQGSVALQRGRFSGRLDAQLDDQGRISGRGTGSLEIRPGLVGTIGIEYGVDQRLKTTGELRFPPYRFLEPRGNRFQLFERSLPDIPIFAIPLGIGAVGLVARIGGSLAVRYTFGPGEIREMVIRATLYPLEDDLQAELSAEARLVLPVEAGIELSVRAGIGASVAFATATGGITVTGGVLLRGGLDAAARLAYARSVLTFDASARISVQPVLTLRIAADLMIEAAIGGPWRWPYELASYSYATALDFGMIAPFRYQSDRPLQLPSPSDIQWIVPQIDVSALASQIAGRVRTGIGM